MLENASTKPLSRELDDSLFHPLSLTNCYLHASGPLRDNSAISYVNPTHIASLPEVSDTPGASSAYCSARDLTRFGEALLGAHSKNWPALSNDLVFRSFSASAGVHYSFGWFERSANGHLAYMAQGGTDRAFAILEIVPDSDLVIAVVANTGTDFPSDVVNDIVQMTTVPKQTQPEPEKPRRASEPSLSGHWTGKVRTTPKQKTVTLDIVSAQDVRLTLGGRPSNCTNVELSPERLYCLGQGVLRNEQQASLPATFDFEVYLHGSQLLGAATTSGTSQLPFVISLQKSDR